MKLERFIKNKKQKRIAIASIITLLVIIGGVTLYKSFALFEDKKEYDVINATVPYFTYNDIQLAVVVNNETKTSLPEKGIYETSVSCTSGTGYWDYVTWSLNLKEFVTGAKCTIYFTSDSSLTEEELIAESNSHNSCSSSGGGTTGNVICKRATTLHTATCSSSSNEGCLAKGYSSGDIITYGSLVTSGSLNSGNAFDCDVNGDGTYDPNTERFYYVSDYYDSSEKNFDSDYATLVYYNNVSSGAADNTTAFAYYGIAKENTHGPVTAVEQLPTTSQWSNVSLKNSSRTILTEKKDLILSSYSYGSYAARLLTAQEISDACNKSVGNKTTGDLDNCAYLMENTMYQSNSLLYGYWIENPSSSNSLHAWGVYGDRRYVDVDSVNDTSCYGIRPAIDVPKSKIDY